jgi:hypothetical protein
VVVVVVVLVVVVAVSLAVTSRDLDEKRCLVWCSFQPPASRPSGRALVPMSERTARTAGPTGARAGQRA